MGVVEAVGEGVSALAPGQTVVGGGGHGTHSVQPAVSSYPLPADLPAERAVFLQLGIIALQGVRKARVELGESVLVLGLGPVGLLAAQLARLAGGMPVVGAERHAFRAALAVRCGVEHVLHADEHGALPEGRVRELAGGRGFDVVIEATGFPDAVAPALRAAAPRGRVVLLGSTRGFSTVNFYEDVHRRGLTVLGAHNGVRPAADDAPGYWTEARDARCVLELLRQRRLEVEPLVSERVRPDAVQELYARLARWDPRLVTALIVWGSRPAAAADTAR